MKKQVLKISRIIATFLLSVISLFCGQASLFAFPVFAAPKAFADETKKEYSNVLDDLKKDSTFDTAHYPANDNDYSLQIIQIAESEDKELFVYVYQPSGQTKQLKAVSINISRTSEIDIHPLNYKLSYLNSDGTLYKYIVENFTVNSDETRYYAIPSIFRKFDSTIDEQATGDNTINEVSYNVGKQWCFSTINGEPYCAVVGIKTIVVTDKTVGYVRYKDGYHPILGYLSGAIDSHYIAFNTDINMDKIIDADIQYSTQAYSYYKPSMGSANIVYGDPKDDNVVALHDIDNVTYNGGGWFAPTYSWKRIQSVSEFMAETDQSKIYTGVVLGTSTGSVLTDTAKEELEGKKWVFRFAETKYESTTYSTTGETLRTQTLVGGVTILRLKFVSAGITYNLGVVDNKQTGGSAPSNEQETDIELFPQIKKHLGEGWWKIIVGLLLLILLLVIFMPLLPTLISLIIKIAILPFRLLAAIFKAIFHKRE